MAPIVDRRAAPSHHSVRHPFRSRHLPDRNWLAKANDRMLTWLTNHVLASMLMFDVALLVPLVAIPLNDSVKITLGVISGSWIQWWALPALQRSQVIADKQRQAKADSDHEALTHIALTVDAILTRLQALEQVPQP